MPGNEAPIPNLPLSEVLRVAELGELNSLPLPTPGESPYDTTFEGRRTTVEEILERKKAFADGTLDVRSRIDWGSGEIVAGTFHFSIPLHGGLSIIAETVSMGPLRTIGVAGEFLFPGSEHYLTQIGHFGLRRFVATAQMRSYVPKWSRGGAKKKQVATILGVHAIERPFEGDFSALRDNEPVLVQGTVEKPCEQITDQDQGGRGLTIRSEGGQLIHVSTLINRYGSSSQSLANAEDIAPEETVAGDIIQIRAVFRQRPESVHILPGDTPSLSTHKLSGRDSTEIHLLRPSRPRIEATAKRQAELDELLGLPDMPGVLESLSASSSRKWIGNLIVSLAEQPSDIPFALPFSYKQALRDTIAAKLPPGTDVSDYLPVILDLETAQIKKYLQFFGRDTLIMDRKEFREFAVAVSRSERRIAGKEALNFLNNELKTDTETQLQMAMGVLHTFRSKVVPQLSETATPTDIDYARELLTQVLAFVERMPDYDAIAEPLIDIYFDTFNTPALQHQRGLMAFVFIGSVVQCGQWDVSVGGGTDWLYRYADMEALGVYFPTALLAYRRAMPDILALLEAENKATTLYDGAGQKIEPLRHYIDVLPVLVNKLFKAPRLKKST
jgi:hypothetical protein